MGGQISKQIVAVLIDTDEPILFTTGFGPFEFPPDDYLPEGGLALGLGPIGDLPETETLLDGTAQTATLVLGGLDPELLNLIDMGSADVEQVDVSFGKVTLDADEQLQSVEWVQTYIIERVTLSTRQTDDEEGAVTHHQTVSIALGYGDGQRRRPTNIYWTNDQAGSGDLGFSNVPGIGTASTRKFPPG